jgi:hypothetical protein
VKKKGRKSEGRLKGARIGPRGYSLWGSYGQPVSTATLITCGGTPRTQTHARRYAHTRKTHAQPTTPSRNPPRNHHNHGCVYVSMRTHTQRTVHAGGTLVRRHHSTYATRIRSTTQTFCYAYWISHSHVRTRNAAQHAHTYLRVMRFSVVEDKHRQRHCAHACTHTMNT